jgi:hypothetical protein
VTETRKVLGQVFLGLPMTFYPIYQVPVATQTVVSTVYICNRTAAPITIWLSVAVNNAPDSMNQYVYYGLPIPGNETFAATVGLTLGPSDVIRGIASNAGIIISAFGVEIT